MMRRRKMTVVLAGMAAAALAVSGCSGDDDSDSSNASGTFTMWGCKPENPLVPANTNEVCGGTVIDAVFSGLVRYDPDTGEPELSMAESIDSSDSTNWDVKLKSGNTFQDGTPVNSDSFINAWNWAAYGPNGAINNYFFAQFDGYDALNPADPDGEDGPQKAPTPTVKTLSGLTKVSDTEFKIKLSSPASFLKTELGYTVFSPLPKAFFDDTDAFAKKPIGNGPLQVTAGDGSTGYTLTKWNDYKGDDPVKVQTVDYKVYNSTDAAYADLQAGNLDFLNELPAAALVDDQFKTDLGEGHYLTKPVGVIDTITTPLYNATWKDPNLAKAISLAIDRPTITKSVFNGARIPATGWVSPVVDGYKAGACGEFCTYDPAKAKEYLAKTTFKGPLKISYNADGPHKESYEAICNSIKNALGIDCIANPYVDLSTMRADINAHKMDAPFRTGWQMDYPSIQNFLEPLYATGASSNDGLFSDPTFDSLIKKANGESGDAALATYQQAEARLAIKMNVIPLWYRAQSSGWSDKVTGIKVTPFSSLDLSSVSFK